MPKNLTPNHFDTAGIYVEGTRSIFGFKKPVQSTFMAGMLNPLGQPIHVFPGTKLALKINASVRSNTMVVPPLDGIYIDFYSVWVPHRIVWNHMPQFLGENDTSAWTQSSSYVYPTITYGKLNSFWSNQSGSFSDQSVSIGNLSLVDKYGLIFGIVPGGISASLPVYNVKINALGIRGYYFLWNHMFRDENYQRPVLFSKGDTGDIGEFGYQLRSYTIDNNNGTIKTIESNGYNVALGNSLTSDKALLMPVNKFHDAFTSVLPQPQFGNAVSMALGTSAPILIDANTKALVGTEQLNVHSYAGAAIPLGSKGAMNLSDGTYNYGTLVADLSNATAATINQLRNSIMTQRYLEALARGGRRVVEYYKTIYGVNNTAASKDYPELIAKSRYMLNVNQVVAQADSSGSGWTSHLGDTGAYSYTVLRDIPVCEREFSEFGNLHIVYCVRCDNRYSQIIQPDLLIEELLQEYNPFFDHIGDVDIPNYTVNTSAGSAGNWGFQEAWWSERTQLAMATGALNKHFGSLKFWVIGEDYGSGVTTCTPGWLTFDPAVLNDIFVTPYYAYPQFIIDACIVGKKVAKMSQHSIPGIVGRI